MIGGEDDPDFSRFRAFRAGVSTRFDAERGRQAGSGGHRSLSATERASDCEVITRILCAKSAKSLRPLAARHALFLLSLLFLLLLFMAPPTPKTPSRPATRLGRRRADRARARFSLILIAPFGNTLGDTRSDALRKRRIQIVRGYRTTSVAKQMEQGRGCAQQRDQPAQDGAAEGGDEGESIVLFRLPPLQRTCLPMASSTTGSRRGSCRSQSRICLRRWMNWSRSSSYSLTPPGA